MKKVFLGSEITFYIAAIAFFIYTNAINAQISNSLNTTKDLADSVNEFALKLYSRTINKTQNYFISPYSVWIAMSMCYAGSGGITKTELKRLLAYRKNNDTEIFKEVEQYLNNFEEVRNASYSLNIANRIFPKKDDSLINPSYHKLIKTYFKSDAQELNFTNNFDAVRTINNWVSNKTANRIKDLMTPDLVNKYTKLVLVNAIYFKGLWLDRFNRSDTTKTPFYLANGTKTNVDMMVIKKKQFRCLTELDDLDASLCELPYEGDKIAMTIILPNKNSSLNKLEQKLDIKKLRNVLNKEKYLNYANIHLPKFKLEYKSEMSDDLIKLGAQSAFSDSADFSGISTNSQLKISKVVHQTFLDVTEGGTEAAAATAVIMTRMTIWDPIEFVCDRPFMFMIHDTISKAILFMGKFNNP